MNTVAHALTVTTTPEGRTTDWPHPTDCPDGEQCDILRRTRRMGMYDMTALGDGRPDGTYLLGLWHFHGLLLIDEHGSPLPDVVEALDPASAAARQVTENVIRELAEVICEDTETLVDLCVIIRRAEHLESWEGAANGAVNAIIDRYLGTMRAYADPIRRLLPDAHAV